MPMPETDHDRHMRRAIALARQSAIIDRTGGFVVSGDRFNGIVLPGDAPTDEAIATFPQLADLQRLYHGLPNGFSETPTDGFQPRLGMAYSFNERTTFRAGVGRFLNRVQINTTAAYGFNPPLSEMQTVINGIVDAPGGKMAPAAVIRNFERRIAAARDVRDRAPRKLEFRAVDAEVSRVARFDGARDVRAALADRAGGEQFGGGCLRDGRHHSPRPFVLSRDRASGASPPL